MQKAGFLTTRLILALCMLGNFACFYVVCCLLSNQLYKKKSFRNTIRVSNSLESDLSLVGPDLAPNCLPRLSIDDPNRQRVNIATRPDKIILALSQETMSLGLPT